MGGQLIVAQVFGSNELQQRVSEQIWVLAVVVPELHLIEVRGKMTGAEMLVRTIIARYGAQPDTALRGGRYSQLTLRQISVPRCESS